MTTITLLEGAILAHLSHSSHMPDSYLKKFYDCLGSGAKHLAQKMYPKILLDKTETL